MLDVTHSHVDVETIWCGVTDSDIFINFYFKMIFSILQVSRDRKTASVRHLSSVVYCKKGHCLETVKLPTWETTVQPWFFSCKNVG